MPENQNIEYKSSWHDDYLKWICGFAKELLVKQGDYKTTKFHFR